MKKSVLVLAMGLGLGFGAGTSHAGEAEITLKAQQPARATIQMMPRSKGPTLQQMLARLRPAPTAVPMGGAASSIKKSPSTSKYEVADCTGSDGKPKVCCSFTPGGGGSTCDVFLALCDSMPGTTSTGGTNGATCSGEGVLE